MNCVMVRSFGISGRERERESYELNTRKVMLNDGTMVISQTVPPGAARTKVSFLKPTGRCASQC